MPTAQPSKELRPFCYEHHVEMRFNQSFLDGNDGTTQTVTYACTEPDCLVYYNISRGYFTPNQNTDEPGTVPGIKCLHDGKPMYLAGLDPNNRSFRLWICPQCDRRRTNEEDLISLASEKIQDASGKSWVEP